MLEAACSRQLFLAGCPKKPSSKRPPPKESQDSYAGEAARIKSRAGHQHKNTRQSKTGNLAKQAESRGQCRDGRREGTNKNIIPHRTGSRARRADGRCNQNQDTNEWRQPGGAPKATQDNAKSTARQAARLKIPMRGDRREGHQSKVTG